MRWTRPEVATPIITAMAVFAETITREGLSEKAGPFALVCGVKMREERWVETTVFVGLGSRGTAKMNA